MSYTKRSDGRAMDEPRAMSAKLGVVPRADGSAMFSFGDTIAIAAVYGPKQLHPQHLQNPRKGIVRCFYDMLSFSVTERKKPGSSRRSQEISKITEWALSKALLLDEFPNTVVDIHISVLQANASTRVAGINAASLALAHAGVPMSELISAVSVGKIDTTIVTDVIKEEEDYEDGEGATDIPMAFLSNSQKMVLLQLDGKCQPEKLKEAINAGEKACREISQLQQNILKSSH